MIATRPLGANQHYAVPGTSTPHRPDMSRHAGTDDSLEAVDRWPGNMGTETGYMGRDVLADSTPPYNAQPGMFRRLHQGA
jgi:hypothetical protein